MSGPASFGERCGLVLPFLQDDFREFESAVSGGILGLIAALREACGAREVIWARDISVEDMLEIVDA